MMRNLVDPELSAVLDFVPDMSVSSATLAGARAAAEMLTSAGLEARDGSVLIEEHRAPGINGASDVRVLLYRPAGLPANAPVILQIHGGGFLFGTAELGDPRNCVWARELNCAIASVEYRLAPEHPYPAALDDCYAALLWLHQSAAVLGLDSKRMVVRGESAGGGLAAALTILARDKGGPPVLFQLLVYPMLDDRTCEAEPHPYAGRLIWDGGSNSFAWASWLGVAGGSAEVPPLAAPARVVDLAGLPPTAIVTAALDLFVEENLEFGRRLLRAGVATEIYVAPGAYHGFDAMVPEAAISRQFTEIGMAALRRAFGPGPLQVPG